MLSTSNSSQISNSSSSPLGHEAWEKQSRERLRSVITTLKKIQDEKKELNQKSSTQIELLKEEFNGLSLISHYVNSSDLSTLDKFLRVIMPTDKEGEFVNHINSIDGSNALFLSIQKGSPHARAKTKLSDKKELCISKNDEIIKKLLEFPAIDVNQETRSGVTPLVEAISKNEFSKFTLLLERDDIDINRLSSGEKPIITSSKLGKEYTKFTFALLARGALLETSEFETVFSTQLLEPEGSFCENKTILGFMSAQGRVEEVRYLLSKGVDINAKSGKKTPIILAVENSRWFVLFELLNASADISKSEFDLIFSKQFIDHCVEKESMTLLGMISKRGNVAEVQYLLSTNLVDVNQEFGSEQSAIWLASYSGHAHIVVELLSAGAIVKPGEYPYIFTSEILENSGAEILKIMCKRGDSEAVRYLSRSEDISSKSINDCVTELSLDFKSLDGIIVLLSNGFEIKESDYTRIFTLYVIHRIHDGKTVFGAMCEKGNLPAIKHILDSNIPPNVNLPHNNEKPLLTAAKNGHCQVVVELLSYGAEISESEYEIVFSENVIKYSDGDETALGALSKRGDINSVKYLLENDAEIDVLSNGKKPIVIAAENGEWSIVLEMLKYNPTLEKSDFEIVFCVEALNIQDDYGNNIFMLLLSEGNQESVDYLCENGIGYFNINHKNVYKYSALHIALNIRDLEGFRKIIKLPGIDLNLTNQVEMTPIMVVARMENESEAMKYAMPLIKAGVKFEKNELIEVGYSNKIIDLLNKILVLDSYNDSHRSDYLVGDEAMHLEIYPQLCKVASHRYGLKMLETFQHEYTSGIPHFSLVISPNFEAQKVDVTATKYYKKKFTTFSYEINFDKSCKEALLSIENDLSSAKNTFQGFAKKLLAEKHSSWGSNHVDKAFMKPWSVRVQEQDVVLVNNAELDKKLVITDINLEPKDGGVAKNLSEISYDGNNINFLGSENETISDENISRLLLLKEVDEYQVILVGNDGIIEF